MFLCPVDETVVSGSVGSCEQSRGHEGDEYQRGQEMDRHMFGLDKACLADCCCSRRELDQCRERMPLVPV